MKTQTILPKTQLQRSIRSLINPIKNLTPQSLTRMLDAFHQGHIGLAAMVWDAIERRDDVIQGVASKRKKAVARLPSEIITLDNSPEAMRHKEALQYFYNNLTATHACDENIYGGFALLVKQVLDAIGKKYSVHEIVFQPQGKDALGFQRLTATFRFVPLWFFENTTGKLRFMPNSNYGKSKPLEPGSWLITAADGLMESCSIAYLFKHLPLRDWLIYCERNGMPGVKGVTDARPGSPQWDAAVDAVRDFGAEFHAVMSRGTDIESIDLTARGELPYPGLIERMDRAIIALWRGSDLTTLSKNQGTGASIQGSEIDVLEADDASLVSEMLNAQVDRVVLKHIYGVERGKAYIRIQPSNTNNTQKDLELYSKLLEMGVPLPMNQVLERFGIPQANLGDLTLTKKANNEKA